MRNDHPSNGIVIPKMIKPEDVYVKKERIPSDAKTRITPFISNAGLNLIKNITPFTTASASVT